MHPISEIAQSISGDLAPESEQGRIKCKLMFLRENRKKTDTRNKGCKAKRLQPKFGHLASFIQIMYISIATLSDDTLGP